MSSHEISDRQGRQVAVRRLTPGDVGSIHSVECHAHSHPMTRTTMENLLSRHQAWGLFEQDTCLGFCFISQVADESELLDLVVSPAQQGRGLGEALLRFALRQLDQKIKGMFLEVRVSNTAATGLYDKLGFIETGIRRNYYPAAKGREDAQLMALDLAMLLDN